MYIVYCLPSLTAAFPFEINFLVTLFVVEALFVNMVKVGGADNFFTGS